MRSELLIAKLWANPDILSRVLLAYEGAAARSRMGGSLPLSSGMMRRRRARHSPRTGAMDTKRCCQRRRPIKRSESCVDHAVG
jgi:hypothetical protein